MVSEEDVKKSKKLKGSASRILKIVFLKEKGLIKNGESDSEGAAEPGPNEADESKEQKGKKEAKAKKEPPTSSWLLVCADVAERNTIISQLFMNTKNK